MTRGLLRLETQSALGQFQSADDHRQHIVEVMGDAASQLADRVHLLHLAQIFFGHRALGRFLLQLFIGIGQLGRARRHRFLQPVGAFRLHLSHASRVAPLCIGGIGDPKREEDAYQQHQPEEPRRAVHRLRPVASQLHGEAPLAQAGIFSLDDAIQQRGDVFQVFGSPSPVELGERGHLLIIGRAQPDFAQRLATLCECLLQFADIGALPS